MFGATSVRAARPSPRLLAPDRRRGVRASPLGAVAVTPGGGSSRNWVTSGSLCLVRRGAPAACSTVCAPDGRPVVQFPSLLLRLQRRVDRRLGLLEGLVDRHVLQS